MSGTVFAVFDAIDSELYAIRYTPEAAQEACRAAREYLDEAAACGHPAAPAWVAERLPFKVVEVPTAELEVLHEQFGTPVMEREP